MDLARRSRRAYAQCRSESGDDDEEGDLEAEPAEESQENDAGVRDNTLHSVTENGEESLSFELLLASSEIAPWWKQISCRGVVVSAFLGALFCVVVHKLSLTTGVVPSLNVSAGLFGFFCIRLWISLIERLGAHCKPFSRQENTVIQTCIVACYGVAYSGGFSTYLLAMDQRTSDIVSTSKLATLNASEDVKNPGLGWMIAFMFAVCFLGLVAVVPLRKILIIDYKLTYPSGTATAVLINSFFTPQGYKKAQEQIQCLWKYFSLSFLFSAFKWIYSGPQGQCGFDRFPSFGLKAYRNKFFFDFNLTYVGAGMICPHIVNFSLLFGGIFSWGLLWPIIRIHAGEWYPADANDYNLQGLYGYKIFIAIALILGDGLYNFLNATYMMLSSLYKKSPKRCSILAKAENDRGGESSYDDQLRTETFLRNSLSFKMAGLCYTGLALISVQIILQIFEEMKWYYVLVSYTIAPILGFCNAYGCGMTNCSPISSYGKIFLFTFAYWAGNQGGVIVGLVSCGLVMVIVSSAADLMQDFKTGYLTLTSPKSMLASQVLGSVIGCVVAPATFWIFWTAFPVGKEDGDYPAPYAVIFREMAMFGVEGFSSLPQHCLLFSGLFFVLAIMVNIIRDCVPVNVAQFIPIPMAMALPFFIGSYFAIDMCIGSIILIVWSRLNHRKADIYIPAVASGLMCGDGVWTLLSAMLALAKAQAPICMYFISSEALANSTLPSY